MPFPGWLPGYLPTRPLQPLVAPEIDASPLVSRAPASGRLNPGGRSPHAEASAACRLTVAVLVQQLSPICSRNHLAHCGAK